MTDRRVSAYAKGVMGENRACEYLCQRGMVPLFQRYHSPFGDIDLVMLEGETLVFVEVKTREQAGETSALYAVTPVKRRRIIETARCLLGEHPEHRARMMRFDIALVTREGVCHLPNAFEGAEW